MGGTIPPNSQQPSATSPGTTVQTAITQPATTSGPSFTISDDLCLIYGYIYKGDRFFLVENTSDKPILEYVLEYIVLDRNGLPLGDSSRAKSSDANLMPGEKKMGKWYGSSGSYAVATVAEISFINGDTWKAKNTDQWVKQVKSSFSLNEYNKQIEGLAEPALKAETASPLHGRYGKVNRNQFSNSDDLTLSLTNNGDKVITRSSFMVLQYDRNGFPVSTSPYDHYVLNDKRTGGSVSIAPGATVDVSDSLFFEAGCEYFKVVVRSLEFSDGSYWDNPYLYEWIIFNTPKYISSD